MQQFPNHTSRRRKIGSDPNNTSWTRSEDGFGQRILKSQGWTPGSYLGAEDASHAEHYTSANASHIRAVLKDDTLGLGAKRGHVEGENFGLGSFQDLLGRLNGKSDEEIQKIQQARVSLGGKLYVGQRWAPCQFIRGGYLVGDKMEGIKSADTAPAPSMDKKRKEKEEEKHLVDTTSDKLAGSAYSVRTDRVGETKEERRQRKLERRARRLEKRTKKEHEVAMGKSDGKEDRVAGVQSSRASRSTLVTPVDGAASGGWAIAGAVGRGQAVRQRFIRQKKMASLDPQALREVTNTARTTPQWLPRLIYPQILMVKG